MFPKRTSNLFQIGKIYSHILYCIDNKCETAELYDHPTDGNGQAPLPEKKSEEALNTSIIRLCGITHHRKIGGAGNHHPRVNG